MPRHKTKSLRRKITPDRKYESVLVQKTINKVMQDGKKLKAETLVYSALDIVSRKTKQDPLEIYQQAIKNVAPVLEVKSRRVGGANYQIPFEVKGERQTHLALMWLIGAARTKKGKPFDETLANEIMDAHNNTGEAVKKKEDTHRMAEANRAFAHLARF
ncbi:MAG: 30S ribosomal protein S7 [Candidatus Saccharimonadales bacterium]